MFKVNSSFETLRESLETLKLSRPDKNPDEKSLSENSHPDFTYHQPIGLTAAISNSDGNAAGSKSDESYGPEIALPADNRKAARGIYP